MAPPEETGGEFKFPKDDYGSKDYADPSNNKFSVNVRYDVDTQGKTDKT